MADEFTSPKLDSSASNLPPCYLSSPETDSSNSRDDMSEDCPFDEQRLKEARKSLENDCLKIFAEERERVKKTFSKFGGQISLSVDILICGKMVPDWYMCLSAHFIDDDWMLQKWAVKYCSIHGDDQEHPNIIISKTLQEWGINNKISTVTIAPPHLDVEDIQERIQEGRDLPLNDQLFHVKCCSDVITRIVEVGFEEISKIISKVQLLSWSKSLPLWYLTSTKLKNALELNDLGEFSSKFVSENEVPSEEEWGKVRSMCRIADRIYEIVKGLFKVERPTSNLFLPHLLEIHTYLTQESVSSDAFTSLVARKMLRIFDEYLKDMYLVLSIGSFMDPRYKMEFISFSSSKLEVGDGDSKSTFVLETIRKLYENYGAVQNDENEYFSSESSRESESEDEEEESGRRARKRKRKCNRNLGERLNILKEYRGSVQPTNDEPNKSDLDIYLEEPILPWTANFNVLVWWKDNCSKYPRLSRMARDFLAIPISVGTSCGAYSIEPREADYAAVSLKPEFMNALMCVRSWNLPQRYFTHYFP